MAQAGLSLGIVSLIHNLHVTSLVPYGEVFKGSKIHTNMEAIKKRKVIQAYKEYLTHFLHVGKHSSQLIETKIICRLLLSLECDKTGNDIQIVHLMDRGAVQNCIITNCSNKHSQQVYINYTKRFITFLCTKGTEFLTGSDSVGNNRLKLNDVSNNLHAASQEKHRRL